MYILSIIPIKKGIPFNTLTYYNSEALLLGTIVQIPFGKQIINGLVYECLPLIEAKAHIKQSNFSLKKIKSVIGVSHLSVGIANGLVEASIQNLTPIGALAGIVFNELFFDLLQKTERVPTQLNQAIKKPSVVYGVQSERINEYKRVIRTAFAEKQSVVLIAPSIRQVEFWYNTLQKGITNHSIVLHSKCTKRDQKSKTSLIEKSERPLFICTTPGFGIIHREDIATIILEDESSSMYKTRDRYETDQRIIFSCIAKSTNIKLIYGDILPRFETLYKTDSTNLARSFTPEKLIVAPTENYRSILPTETIELIRYCQKNKKSLFIYTNRKGIAPISRCNDCGTTVDCKTCGLPIVLRYKLIDGEKKRMFICTHCGDTLLPTHTCVYCGSWNINPVSIGTESLQEEVVGIVGDQNVISVDDDINLDEAETAILIENIKKKKSFVMIGTQKLLPFIKGVDFIAIPFFDRILSVPSPFVVEETLRLLIECNEYVKENLIICTKNPEFTITKQLATKKINSIISDDLESRKILKYPPFGILLKISITIPNGQSVAINDKIHDFFHLYDVTKMPMRKINHIGNKLLGVWIIQINDNFLEDHSNNLRNFLENTHLPYKIDIDPHRF